MVASAGGTKQLQGALLLASSLVVRAALQAPAMRLESRVGIALLRVVHQEG